MLALAGAADGAVGRDAGPQASFARSQLGAGLAASLRASHQRAARANSESRLVVVARRGRTAALAARLRAVGARVESHSGRVFDVVARRTAARSLGADAISIRPQGRSVPEAILGEGVAATQSSDWLAHGLTGAGSRVAIIDVGFGGLQQAQAAGEINPGAITIDDCHGAFSGERHGTAVAEIVSEEAPGAQLYLICEDSEASLLQAEQYAVANGVNVINHSVGWFGEWAGDGRGPAGTPDAVAADAAAHNILWVNAAGNEALVHWAGTWKDANNNGALDFIPGDEINDFIVPQGGTVCVSLRWNEWPAAQHDYDLYLYDEVSGQTVARSEADQTQTHGSPVEDFCYANPGPTHAMGFAITVYGAVGAAPLDVFVDGTGPLQWQVSAGSIVDPAASTNTLAVGAVCWQNQIGETFSSRGPTSDGRVKPDLVGPDRVSGLTYGPFDSCGGRSGFAGTSAASPYLAGAAALVHQRYPSLTAAQLKSYLVAHALDLGDPGVDNTFGAGIMKLPFLQLPNALYPPQSATAVTRHEATLNATVTPGDSDTAVKFEYGPTADYGTTVTAATISADKPANPVAVQLTGLTAGTTYHFRVVATNLAGPVFQGDQTFTTQQDLAPTVKAHRAVGKLGRPVLLSYTLGDDTGEARADVAVFQGAKKVASFPRDFTPVGDANAFSVSWHAPKTIAKGAFLPLLRHGDRSRRQRQRRVLRRHRAAALAPISTLARVTEDVEGEVIVHKELDAEAQARRRLALAQIRQYPDPILRMTAKDVTQFDEDLSRLVSRLELLMHDANGVGLAATQIGIIQRVFVFTHDGEDVAVVNPSSRRGARRPR